MPRNLLALPLICAGYLIAHAAPEGMMLRGQATFGHFGFAVYDARLFTPEGAALDWQADFGLELTYRRNISQKALIDSTLAEMQRIGHIAPPRPALADCFRDVRKGDRFLAVTQGADRIAFLFNGTPVCTLSHTGIRVGFMSVFLGDDSRSARFTRLLRGE